MLYDLMYMKYLEQVNASQVDETFTKGYGGSEHSYSFMVRASVWGDERVLEKAVIVEHCECITNANESYP